MSYRQRDSQQSKVYRAENAAFGSHYDGSIPTVANVEDYVRKVTGDAWFRKTHGIINVKVRPGNGARRAIAYHHDNSITMPRGMRSKWVVLHEIAHLTIPYQLAGHGWAFCSNYLGLVRHFLGQEAHDRLRASFKKHGVRYTEPRKRKPLTPEQRERAVANLEAARAAKAAKTPDPSVSAVAELLRF